ncbi:mCE-family protein mce4F [Mycobacterium xenopi 4042]|uniref:MCE-family protein mce4F n=1 Tax=Mycobacterium xenopi 4042 TaxID=1299334 RepID=X7ZX57_MYCXE|nr:mCE-family protein mce4F [Mycobacterium xenopi 4042]
MPQASGPAYTTYDQHSGAFTDPAGGTGIFAPGMSKASSAENWVDLMRDPRQL